MATSVAGDSGGNCGGRSGETIVFSRIAAGGPSALRNAVSHYLQQHCQDQEQKIAMDNTSQELWEVRVTNEILAKKMRGQNKSRVILKKTAGLY